MDYSGAMRIVKNYGARSFFFKHFLYTFIPFFALFGIISFAMYSNNRSDRLNELERYNTTLLLGISHVVENTFSEAENSYISLYISNPENMEIFLGSSNTASPQFAVSVRDIQRTLRGLTTPQVMHSVYLSGVNSGFVISSSFLNPNAAFDDFRDQGWHRAEGFNEVTIFPRKIAYSRYTHVNVLTIVYPIFRNQVKDGYFIVNLDYRRFVQNIRQASAHNAKAQITNAAGDVLLSTMGNEYEILGRNLTNSISRGMYVTLWYMPDGNGTGFWGVFWTVLIILLLIATAAAIALFLTFHYYKSIINIIQAIQASSAEHSGEKNAVNEISFIISSILSILSRQSTLESELLQRLTMLNKAQALSLQSQLNPHFLFNTLHIISSIEMAEHKKETPITIILSLLRDILSEALDTSEAFITLEREIAFSQKYLEIINHKYENKIILDLDIDDAVKKLLILKLSIQPLVENSVHHGLSDKTGRRVISVSAKKEDENLKIAVRDNGSGISENKLSIIRAKMEKINIEHKDNIGLANTNQRIKLIFGDSYGCNVTSDKNTTTVEMLLPILETMK